MHEGNTWGPSPALAGGGFPNAFDPAAEKERRQVVTRATTAFAVLAVVAIFVAPPVGFVAAALLFALAALDWRVSNRVMIAGFAALVVLVPGDLRVAGGLPIDVSADRVALIALVAAYSAGAAARTEVLSERARRVGRPLLALFGVAALSLFANISRANDATGGGLKGLLSLGSYIALYFLIVSLVTREDVLPICRVIVATSGLVGLTAMLERLSTANPIREALGGIPGLELANLGHLTRGEGIRVAGTAEHPIAFGGLMAMVLPIALYLMFTEKKHRALWVATTAFIGGSMVLSVSRSALIAAAAGYLTLFAVWPKRRLALASLALVGLLGVHIVFPGVLGAFQATFSPQYFAQQESMQNPYNRVSDYPRVRAIIPNQPMLGLSYNAFDPQTYFFLDNQLLKFVLEVGFIGTFFVVLFVWRVGAMLVRAIGSGSEADRALAAALLGAVISFALLSVFFDTFGFSQITWMFFIFAALGVRFASRPAEEPEPALASELAPERVRPQPAEVAAPAGATSTVEVTM